MKRYSIETLILFAVMSGSRILHSISQIQDHNAPTWLPDWILNGDDWFSFSSVLDSYHVIKDLSFEAMLIAGFILGWKYYKGGFIRFFSQFIISWFLSWQVFNLFYEGLWRP